MTRGKRRDHTYRYGTYVGGLFSSTGNGDDEPPVNPGPVPVEPLDESGASGSRRSGGGQGRFNSLSRRIYRTLRDRGPLADWELEEILDESHQSTSAARRGLVKNGFVRPTGRFTKTRNGVKCNLWEIVPVAQRSR